MNPADSIVTDVNILHIIECFSPSSVTLTEDRFCLLRTRSFTLFKNVLDYIDNSNSVPSFPMINCCDLAPHWVITTGCPDRSGVWIVFPRTKKSDPTNRERKSRPFSIQRPKRWFRILLNCVKLKFVSYTSNLLEQTYDFQKSTTFFQKWILSPQDLLQNRSLETVPACIVLQYYHIAILFVFTCVMNVRYQSIQSFVTSFGPFRNRSCKFIHWEYQVFQYVPSTSISEQFERMLLTILLQISILPLRNDGHRCREWILCGVVESSCWLTISLHTFLRMTFHIIRPWRHTKILRVRKLFSSPRGNSRFKHGSVIVHNISAYFTLSLSAAPSIHDQGKMLVLPNRLLCWVISTSDQDFVSFQPILCHPHTQIRIILFHDVQRDIPNLEFSPSHASIGFSQIAFPITVLPTDDHTDCVQEERLGLPYWTMI